MELFTDTEPANFCCGVVWCSSFHDIPVDVKRDALSFEIPDILAQSGPFPLLILRIDVSVMLIDPGLQRVVGGTSVGFPVVGVSPGDGGPVHHIVHHAANPWENSAGFRLFLWEARTSILLLGCCSIIVVVIVTIQNFIIVSGDFPLHVVHAPVTDFNGVSIAVFMKWMCVGKCLLDDV